MTKIFILSILFFYSLILPAQTVRGTVVNYETGRKEVDAEVVLKVNDSIKYQAKTDKRGKFIFENISPRNYDLFVFQTGRTPEQILNINFISNNDIVVMLHEEANGIICTTPINYVCEEDNPNYVYTVNSNKTINFTDSIGQKQGLWIYTYDRHIMPESKYEQNQLLSKGYYKNDKKIGRWIYVKPNGQVSEVITYENDHIISRTKHCVAH